MLCLLFFSSALVNLSHANEYTLEIGLGSGLWGGSWSQATRDTDSSLGLATKALLMPALAASLNWQGPHLFGPVSFNASAGLGLWSGSLAGVQDGDLERAHSILAFALEARPTLSAEFSLSRGELITELSLGTGFVLGPILAIDDLPGYRSVSKTSPLFLKRFFGTAGLGLGYRPNPSFSFLLRTEAALADFDEARGSKPTWMGRFMVSMAYALPAKERE
ncbi:MAG TPA: hypothetical protein DCG47_05270 [Spirochaetaceae bacterium]|nr:hypothetical protein [Spirochaetaceae bacterium]